MTKNLKFNKMSLSLTGNEMTGNTYPVKGFISTKLGGKWDGSKKAWIVDVNQVNYWIEKGAITVHGEAAQPAAHKHANGICPICHTYCDGDCTAK